MYFLLEKVDFHCYVSLPEGKRKSTWGSTMRLTWCGLGLHSLLSVSNLSQMMADISHEVKTIEDFICFPMKPPFQISWDQVQKSEKNIWKIDRQSQALMIEGHLWFKKKVIYLCIYSYVLICMSIMLQNRGVLGMLPLSDHSTCCGNFGTECLLWRPCTICRALWLAPRMPWGGRRSDPKRWEMMILMAFFPFRNDSKGWDPWVRGVVKCAKHWRPQ